MELINATHAGREMFLPYTVASLERRLRLSPSYGLPQWRAYRSRDGIVAAAGVWDYNRSLRITHRAKSGGSVRTSLPAYVLDYGYAAGAEEAMLEVIMAMMDIAAAAGEKRSVDEPAGRAPSLLADGAAAALDLDVPHPDAGHPDAESREWLGLP